MVQRFNRKRDDDLLCSDEQLCALALAGDADAEAELVTRYYALVRACARPLFLAGGDGEDLIQEGMFGLLQAIREYDEGKSPAFHAFAEVCIRNRLYSALRAAARDKHAPLNCSVSLDQPFFESDSCRFLAFADAHADPELLIADRDYVESVLREVTAQLSDFETQVLRRYLEGHSCREIAALVGKTPKSVDNAVQRVRRKVARAVSGS